MSATTIVCLVFGAIVVIGGLFVLRDARATDPSLTRWGLSLPTRLLAGVVLLVTGYHIAAWGSPDHWFSIKIPARLWPLPVVLAAIGLAGSIRMDRKEAHGNKGVK